MGRTERTKVGRKAQPRLIPRRVSLSSNVWEVNFLERAQLLSRLLMKRRWGDLQRYLPTPVSVLLLRLRKASSHFLGERLGEEVNFSREQHQREMCEAIHHHRLKTFVVVHPCHPIDPCHHKVILAEAASILDQEAPHLLQEEIEDHCHLTVVEEAHILDLDLPLHAGDDPYRHIVVHRILGQDLLLHVGDDPCHHKVVVQVVRLVIILDRGLPLHVGDSQDPSRRRLHVPDQGEVGDSILGQECLLLGG
mmetsp:Transcript_12792/g.19179  ORF Transcript_12792/g.19179 Transcript_12792/m.19179 type:complete len:250 (+) Transcript_12792:334-1083(+)